MLPINIWSTYIQHGKWNMEQSKLQLWKKQMIRNTWTSTVFLQPFGVCVCVSSPSRKVIKGKHVLCDAYRLTGLQPVMELEDCPNSIGRIQSRIALLERSMSRKQKKMNTGNMHKKKIKASVNPNHVSHLANSIDCNLTVIHTRILLPKWGSTSLHHQWNSNNSQHRKWCSQVSPQLPSW